MGRRCDRLAPLPLPLVTLSRSSCTPSHTFERSMRNLLTCVLCVHIGSCTMRSLLQATVKLSLLEKQRYSALLLLDEPAHLNLMWLQLHLIHWLLVWLY